MDRTSGTRKLFTHGKSGKVLFFWVVILKIQLQWAFFAHYVTVSKFKWKPFWLATQRDPQNDLTATQSRVNYDVFAQTRPWQKKRALKFALKGSGSFKACFELYRCLNPEKRFKLSFKNDCWAFFHDFCSTVFWVAAWVQVEFRSLSSFKRCMLFDWLLLLLLLSKFTFSRDCVQGWWVRSSKVCFSAMADCISAKSHALNWALKCYKSFKTKL